MDQKSATKALSTLLHQIFNQKESLTKYAMSDFNSNGSSLPENFSKLWSILTSAAADPQAGHIICVLDALDEYGSLDQMRIVDESVKFYSDAVIPSQTKSTLKFVVTSRPYYDIESEFRQLTSKIPTIRLSGDEESEAISREIDLVIEARVSELGPKLGHSRQELLRKKLLQIPHRTYLWLKLIFEVISDCIYFTKATINEAIATIPVSVEEAYEAILSRVKKRDISRARRLLCIVLAAVRPLTLREMNIALAIQQAISSHADLDLQPEESFESTVRNLCGLFVSVVDSKIYLIYQTAREFLLSQESDSPLNSPRTKWKHSLTLKESNLEIAEACIAYLLSTEVEGYPHIADTTHIPGHFQKLVNQYSKNKFFLDYSAKHWGTHVRLTEVERPETIESVLKLCNAQSGRFMTWFLIEWAQHHHGPCPFGFTQLITAAYLGLAAIVQQLLRVRTELDPTDNHGRTPLFWAVMNSHKTVVQILIKAGADVNSRDVHGHTPLHKAVLSEDEAGVRLLLEAGADVNSRDINNYTPLHYAVLPEDEAVVRLLLEAGAPWNGYTEIVKILHSRL